MSDLAALMLQGTGSDVGKSLVVTGLCRYFQRLGIKVRPFKPQNMSNNAAVTADGGEIGRAQALQALACREPASVHMNPVLLKPQSDMRSQLIIQGKLSAPVAAREYFRHRQNIMTRVMESFAINAQDCDLVLVEGAGSASEINLRSGDIANMGFASQLNMPVAIVGDISRGGVIAAMVGTHAVISSDDRKLVKGYLINKFCGDHTLFADGITAISQMTGWPDFGIIPWFEPASLLPAEDSLGLKAGQYGNGAIKIAVPLLGTIANFDDLDPLRLDPAIRLELVAPGNPLPTNSDWLILPGSKNTIADLEMLRQQGWDKDISAHLANGGRIFGICGGYQMLGQTIADPDGIDGKPAEIAGLGLLPLITVMTRRKRIKQVKAQHIASNVEFAAYEIHVGDSKIVNPASKYDYNGGYDDDHRPFCFVPDDNSYDGVVADQIQGCYMHGLFADDQLRQAILATSAKFNYWRCVDNTIDQLADHLSRYVDADGLLATAKGFKA